MSTHTRPTCPDCRDTLVIHYGNDSVECPFHDDFSLTPEQADRLWTLIQDDVAERKSPLWLRLLVIGALAVAAWAVVIGVVYVIVKALS